MYAVRLVVLYLADSVGMYYFAMSLQMFTYAIMLPATVYLVNYACLPQDRNKGQSLIMTAETAASLLASLLGGQLFQIMGEKQVLLLGVIVSAVGAVSLIAALTRVPPRGQTTAGGAQ
jgi:PPP family 3-phenylpropionic acid transporter